MTTTVPPLAGHVGQEQTFQAGGKTWKVGRWNRAVWRDYLAWASTVIPDPRKAAAEFLAMLPDTPENVEQRNQIVRQALTDAQEYLSPNSPRVVALLNSIDGSAKLFELLLKAGGHTDMTHDAAYDLLIAIGTEEAQKLATLAAGLPSPPKENGEYPASPK